MIPQIQTILQSLGKKDKKTMVTKKSKFKQLADLQSNTSRAHTFSEVLSSVAIDAVFKEYRDKKIEELIDDIVLCGKKYKMSRKDEDLNYYKMLLSVFIQIGVKKAYRIESTEKYNREIEENELLLMVQEVEKRMKVIMEHFLISQMELFKYIDEIEGIIIHRKL